MKLHPLLLSAPMVLAFQAGRKRQTRRHILHRHPMGLQHLECRVVYEIAPGEVIGWTRTDPGALFTRNAYPPGTGIVCHIGLPGDFLWIREGFRLLHISGNTIEIQYTADNVIRRLEVPPAIAAHYIDRKTNGRSRPGRFMPLAFCRYFVRVQEVRPERVGSISEADAKQEGIEPLNTGFYKNYGPGPAQLTAVNSFGTLWESLHGANTFFSVTPSAWVWVITFDPVNHPDGGLSAILQKKLGSTWYAQFMSVSQSSSVSL